MPQGPEPSISRQAELILAELDTLPTLPTVATRLMSVSSADDADLKEIIRLIETDPVLTARVLSLCRRTDARLGDRIGTVHQAVVMLGLEAVQCLVLSLQVFQFDGWQRGRAGAPGAGVPGEPPGAAFDADGFWRHSIAVACCAELLAREHKGLGIAPPEAFVAGLVHDLGKLALETVLPAAYGRVIMLAEHRQANIADLERSVFGLDHHTAGKRLAERWSLPRTLQDVMWLHGQPYGSLPQTVNRGMAGLVGVADAMCRQLHLGWSGNYLPAPASAELLGPLGLDERRVAGVIPRVHAALGERCEDLGLGAQPGERLMLDSLRAANRQLGRLNEVLQRRSRGAQDQARVLEAVRQFACSLGADAALVEVVGCVVASAAGVLGPGFYGAVYEPAGGEGNGREGGKVWLAMSFTRQGQRSRGQWVDAQGEWGGAGLAAVAQMADGAARLDAWLARHADAGARGGPVGATTLLSGERGTIVLVHDRGAALAQIGEPALGALLATWIGALGAAVGQEGARRVGEQLAEANLVLAQTQKQLADAGSMVRLGELTAGAAHEMNNPLAVISGRAQALASRLTEGRDKEAAAAIVEATARLSGLIARLHLIASPPAAAFAGTSVVDLVGEVIKEARERVGARSARAPLVPIKVTIAGPLPPARMDRELMHRALYELVVNAIESGARDFVEVRVQTDPVDDRLLIQVIDSGSGMSEHALQHAFDPFFSEKPAGRQAGLGLPTAERLVALHGGRITLESAVGKGTTATVALPDWRWHEPGAVLEAA